MEGLKKFMSEYGTFITLALVLILFFRTCGMNRQSDKLEKKIKEVSEKADNIITEEKMIELIKETPAWKTLRIEEISDKERISINALEEKED